tara:strand:+ start:214 stop:558 length:345 start_codon:yes stop_codon:yes gene_type:complete
MITQYTELANGKRHWKQTIYLAEMFDRYHRGERDSHDFFRTVFKGELGLKEGGFTSYVGVYKNSYSDSLVVGGKVSIFHFDDYKWVVKHGAFEEVVEDMEVIFEVIRRAWAYYD